MCAVRQVPLGEEVAPAEEAPGGAGPEARLEGLLGVSERHYAALLPVRITRGAQHRAGTQTPHHRGRRHHAVHPRAPQAGAHLLPEHGLRRRLSVPGDTPKWETATDSNHLILTILQYFALISL